VSRDLGVLGDGLDGDERLLTGGSILLVGQLLLQGRDGSKLGITCQQMQSGLGGKKEEKKKRGG